MPVNYQNIQAQIRTMGQDALPRAREIQMRLELAQNTLIQSAKNQEALIERVDRALAANSSLRCATPGTEPLDSRMTFPQLTCQYVLLAADGSQVVPNHHDPVEFGVINVGAIRVFPGQGQPPKEIVDTRLLCHDEVYSSDGQLLTEEVVALMRDIAERKLLAELAGAESLPVVALTDGQLEIFGGGQKSSEFKHKLEEYVSVLGRLAGLNVVTAGYVAKPHSDLVLRLLDLALLDEGELRQADQKRRFIGLTDAALFSRILQPGERSAVFGIQSKPSSGFEGPLSLHFFYYNACTEGYPHMARVEFPAWVAQDESLVDLLHYALVCQCRQMGSRPYPYVLHRAHEVAVVSIQEKQELENMIIVELRRRGMDVADISDKLFHKMLRTRARYTR